MKKVLAILLALAMSASATMMAFAEVQDTDVAVGTDTEFGDDYAANTDVNILVKTSNISVTVPLEVTIVADVMGGPCATPDNYKIINNSIIPVSVSNMKITSVDADWQLVENAVAAKTAQSTTGLNDLYMTVADQNLYTVNAAGATGVNPGWQLAAEGEKDLTLVASSSMLDFTTKTDDAVVIVYTIEAAA